MKFPNIHIQAQTNVPVWDTLFKKGNGNVFLCVFCFRRYVRPTDRQVDTHAHTFVCRGRLLTASGRSPPRCPSAWRWPCWPRCAGRPGGNAGTPERPVGCNNTPTVSQHYQVPAAIDASWLIPGLPVMDSTQAKAKQKKKKILIEKINKAYLYPTNLGAYLWIWVLNSDGLTASLLDDVHMVCISLANSNNRHAGSYSHTQTSNVKLKVSQPNVLPFHAQKQHKKTLFTFSLDTK